IAHAGYLLIGVACFDVSAISFYLAAYLLMTLLSFAVLIIVAQQTGEQIADFDGLAKRSPFLAFAMLVGMISLAGVPFTAGFLGKFFIFYTAIAHHQTALVVVGVITVGCGFYYYLKVVRAMYWESSAKLDKIPVNGLSRLAISLLIIATIWLAVYRQPIAFARVAGNARANHVLPCSRPSAIARHDVIEIELAAVKNLAAVLAGVLVALKHVVPGKFHFLLWKPIENQKHNHPRDTNFERNRRDYLVIRSVCRQVTPAFEIMCHEIVRVVR